LVEVIDWLNAPACPVNENAEGTPDPSKSKRDTAPNKVPLVNMDETENRTIVEKIFMVDNTSVRL
jgi:hypothetical protein